MDRKTPSSQGGGTAFFLLGLILSLGVGWFVFPQVLYSEKQQPINFSHPVHIDNAGMSCEDCHFFREDGSWAGYPTLEKCAECHAAPMTDSPDEAAFVAEYVEKGKEVPWLTYQYQPDNVFFSHIAHNAFDCTECHPDVAKMEKAPTYYRNRLSGYSKQTMKMWQCERCHAENGVSNACFVCHK